ncbi:MAG: hypothetical protein E7480_01970 [Ruminococcaceae bacterium]|nr:hypothetical protein [Oscillospiraceae bacterium]
MLKLICACAVVSGAFIIGNIKAGELLKREKSLLMFIYAVSEIKSAVNYCATPIQELFKMLDEREVYKKTGIFKLDFSQYDKKTSQLFEEKIKLSAKQLCLNKDDLQIICSFFENLEQSDRDGAIAICERTLSNLEKNRIQAYEKSLINGRLYRTLGLFTGVIAVLLFI